MTQTALAILLRPSVTLQILIIFLLTIVILLERCEF